MVRLYRVGGNSRPHYKVTAIMGVYTGSRSLTFYSHYYLVYDINA